MHWRRVRRNEPHTDRHAQPFVWTATAATILWKMRHCESVRHNTLENRCPYGGTLP